MEQTEEIQSSRVREYFEKSAAAFDSIYSGQKNAFARWLDHVLRKDMYERFRLTQEECATDDIRSILDVGTGSGRFCLPLADQKDRTVGIDFSAPMIELAREYANKLGVADKCDFRVSDFLDVDFQEPFDAIMAIGLFDYIKAPEPFLEKMRLLTRRKVVATFPSLWTWRAPIRWIRLGLLGCPVYFYSKSRVQALCAKADLNILRLDRVGKIFFLVAEPRSGGPQ